MGFIQMGWKFSTILPMDCKIIFNQGGIQNFNYHMKYIFNFLFFTFAMAAEDSWNTYWEVKIYQKLISIHWI